MLCPDRLATLESNLRNHLGGMAESLTIFNSTNIDITLDVLSSSQQACTEGGGPCYLVTISDHDYNGALQPRQYGVFAALLARFKMSVQRGDIVGFLPTTWGHRSEVSKRTCAYGAWRCQSPEAREGVGVVCGVSACKLTL